MDKTAFQRTIIVGNTASGKSWLAQRLAPQIACDVIDLDQIRWTDGDYTRREVTSVAIAKTVAAAQSDTWIIEGVYGWLVSPIMARATCLIWTDIAWEESRANLLDRETARGADGNFKTLEEWSQAYWVRETGSSYAAHLALFDAFKGPKFRLQTMAETSTFGFDT